MSGLKLGFAGSPDFAATILASLVARGRAPVVIYTQPDRPTGRGRRTRPGPVAQLAVMHGIDLLQPASLREPDAAAILASFQLDVLVVAAYGLLLPQPILDVPAFGCINVHASLLPRWRGAAPVERAIMAGDSVTGVSIMQMDRGLDTGPVYLSGECPIGPDTTGPDLESTLATLGTELLVKCLDALPGMTPAPQPSVGVCYAPKLTQADAAIDWSKDAPAIGRQVRALCGRLPAFTFADDARVQILEATPTAVPDTSALPGTVIGSTASGITVACGAGALRVERLQLNRGKGLPMRAADALNGYPSLFSVGRGFHAGA